MSSSFRVGVFVVGALLIFCGSVFIIGSQDLMFRSTYKVRADFQNVAGLGEGAQVRVGGIRKGTVVAMHLPERPDGKVNIVMSLDRSTRTIVKKDSTASIRGEGLLGDKYVEVSFGSNDAPRLKDGETIASEPPVDLADLIKSTNQILDSTKNTMQSVESISAKVDRGEGTAGALINDKKLYQQATAASNQAKTGLTAFGEDMEALKHNFLLRGFFNRRGYEDAADLTKHEVARLPAGPSLKTFDYDVERLFEKKDGAKLKNTKSLNEAGQFLEANRYGLAVVVGFAGTAGDSEKNKVLTEARAMVVRDYLVKNFKFDDARLKTFGAGEKGEVKGDKVEIVVYKDALAKEELRR